MRSLLEVIPSPWRSMMAKRSSVTVSYGDIEDCSQIGWQHRGRGPVDRTMAVRAERDQVGSGVVDLGRGEQRDRFNVVHFDDAGKTLVSVCGNQFADGAPVAVDGQAEHAVPTTPLPLDEGCGGH